MSLGRGGGATLPLTENHWLRYISQAIPQLNFYIFKGGSFDLLNLTCNV